MDIPAGARPRPASTLEGCRLCGKESSSPDSESGEQWTPFSKVNLVPGGKRIQGAQKPSAVLSANICLSVCLSSALRVFACQHLAICVFVYDSLCLRVCRHCLWSRSPLVHRSLLSLLTYSPFLFFSDVPSSPFIFGGFSEQANCCGGN